ncbi:MAG TPA: hypothetical protein VG963_28335, partial [Polyangiaceae bacterium]|nr:hypothetical protein [Polyangiaceae bacterium]
MLQHGVAVSFGDTEQDVITARVPVEVMLQAARRMTEPSPPADLGLAAALSDNFLAENARSSSSGLHPRSVLERSAWQQQAREAELGEEESPSSGLISAGAPAAGSVAAGALATGSWVAGVAGPASATPAPPLAAQFGLQELIDEVPEPRDWHLWARTHGLWIGVAVLALGLGASFAVRWLAPPAPAAVGQQASPAGSRQSSQLVG